MRCIIKGARVLSGGIFSALDVRIVDEHIAEIAPEILPAADEAVIDGKGRHLFPGFTDVHVHLREPGFSYKETIETGTRAAAAGGYARVCAMPNIRPVPDNLEALREEMDMIDRTARVRVVPYGAITAGQHGQTLSQMAEMDPYVAGFSDDGRGVQSDAMMRAAMLEAKKLGKIIVAHCEDERLLSDVCVHEGVFSEKLGVFGNAAQSEWKQLKRDLRLVRETGAKYHACHLSSAVSVQLMRQAKKEGLDVTCETAPHYLTLNDTMLKDEGRFRMNPPIRAEADRRALVEGLIDGTVDMVATDHAPHAKEEKQCAFLHAQNGVTGLECAFAVLYTNLVRKGIMPLETLVERMALAPARRFGFAGGEIAVGAVSDLTLFNLERAYVIVPETFESKGKSTPFAGWKVFGACEMTMVGGKIQWQK